MAPSGMKKVTVPPSKVSVEGPETEIVADPVRPSIEAVIVTTPENAPLTSPFPSTEAIRLSLLDQDTERALSTAPAEDRGVAESWSDPSVDNDVDPGETDTSETGTTVTVSWSHDTRAPRQRASNTTGLALAHPVTGVRSVMVENEYLLKSSDLLVRIIQS
jgi:hypothetical protein